MTKKTNRTNKKRVRTTALEVIGLMMFLLLVGRIGYWETHYNKEAVVIAVDGQMVEVEDETENTWAFYGDGYNVGDKVVLRMFNNGTDLNIYDDEIEDVKLH